MLKGLGPDEAPSIGGGEAVRWGGAFKQFAPRRQASGHPLRIRQGNEVAVVRLAIAVLKRCVETAEQVLIAGQTTGYGASSWSALRYSFAPSSKAVMASAKAGS